MSTQTDQPSPSPQLHYFMVYAPDQTDPDALARRLAVRPQHLEDLKERVAAGITSKYHLCGYLGYPALSPDTYFEEVAGALLTPESLQDGAERRFVGSAFVVRAENVDAVMEIMKKDQYWTGNVVSIPKYICSAAVLIRVAS